MPGSTRTWCSRSSPTRSAASTASTSVKVTKARPDDRYGDIHVDLERSRQVYEQWKALTRPAPGPNNLRRPLWYARPYKPTAEMFVLAEEERETVEAD
ncbi:MAG: hypothetical protein R3A46_16605 [Thermomicrobiales bacterium]